MIPLAIRVYLQNKGKRMDQDIERLFEKMCDPNESEAYLFADKLGLKADEEAKNRLIEMIKGDNWEVAYLACRALSKTHWQEEALDAIFEVIFDKKNKNLQGAFVQILEEYNLSERFVDVFRVYLFGNFKASTLAKDLLDQVEFEITPRTIRKAEKHWNHYLHNPEDEGSVSIKKSEVEPMLLEMRELFS
ncbi:hypothetical protein SAMN04488519_102414 [Algoriphagus ornithinivorans]|uniref:HEAT repeat-containing protein n=2 Tax=Algoriphagus ornithinivorans TaxID=226506 RepID=A0A1I5CWQ6_9BACT|nr:hypothetical protein SAMN04488519_102414 [Algoriphagus ornithinivorans]